MTGLYLVGGAVALGFGTLLAVRSLVSRKWGSFSSSMRLEGQVIVLTGGNVGLGLEVAKDLAARGATLILACRSWERTRLVLDDLRKSSKNNDVHFIRLDLNDFKSVEEFVQELTSKYTRLDKLICNAGVWVPMDQSRTTQQGFEIHAGVNHLGHALLTTRLLPLLQKTANSRLVFVSSGLAKQGKIELDKYDQFKEGRVREAGSKGFAPTGYCDSKLMNALYTRQLASNAPWLTSVSVCPGFCKTQLSRYVNIPLFKKILFLPVMLMFMRSAARGAQNIIFAALEDSGKLVNGGFYRECKLDEDMMSKQRDQLAEATQKLWECTETVVKAA